MARVSPSQFESGSREWANRRLILLLAALSVAAVLRFAFLEQKPLWCDELATLQRQELTLREHIAALKGNHPLHELFLRVWMSPDASDVRLRLPSACFGIGAVILVGALVRSSGRRASLYLTWFVALSPLHLMYSRIGRPYALAALLAILSNLCFLWAIRRPRFMALAAYAVATAAMIYANLLSATLWLAQGLFLLWFMRKRWRRLRPWIGAHAAVGLLILPWMLYSAWGAITWSEETTYTAQQMGRLFKLAHVTMALCVGETVHPLNFKVVLPAAVGFGAALLMGLRHAVRRRRSIAAFLAVQVFMVFGVALYFGAAAPKHLIIMLPAWLGLCAIGIAQSRKPVVRVAATGLIVLTMTASLFNYFTDRQFTDADMVTPWREITAAIEDQDGDASRPEDIFIGYQMDRGAYDMFRRYYRGGAPVHYVDFEAWRGQLRRHLDEGPVWLLLHKGDPVEEIESWLAERYVTVSFIPFQMEEHTLKGLHEWRRARGRQDDVFSWLATLPGYARKYRSPLYRLYYVEPQEAEGAISGGS